ncbi:MULTISPECIES: hypothetical protein [unclassified Streptomyces]|uniref:hypothetical protein n=1 Tax=unclassified Streptomyces TaxID=2593676 RepID=UPI002250B398|nr:MULTISPECIES: hypothetical protein [unclassified Streptomyces]MCX5147985.1 hypothetical protein [Streptomyces sp. NBC_00320]WSN51074.1 hypothetical protein OG299_27055 [Streptomyces sp. NBC_01296]WSW59474.1 hypothetical protein OG513_13260 [Streptomyces sp. NBC_00998]
MTAETPSAQTPDPATAATAAPDRGEQERRAASRIEGWSIAWMLLALMIWGWFAFLMLADYGPEFDHRAICRGPLVGPLSNDRQCRDELHQWPALLGVLALAALATVVAAATTVYAKVLFRLAHREGPGAQPQE